MKRIYLAGIITVCAAAQAQAFIIVPLLAILRPVEVQKEQNGYEKVITQVSNVVQKRIDKMHEIATSPEARKIARQVGREAQELAQDGKRTLETLAEWAAAKKDEYAAFINANIK